MQRISSAANAAHRGYIELISRKAAGLVPYTAGEQPRGREYIKLNTNENPYAPGAKVISALKSADFSRLRLYPDPDSTSLREAAAAKHSLDAENIFCGNGSDEILAFCFQAFFDADGSPVYFPDVTYSFYPVWCNLFGISYQTPPLNAEFAVNPDDYTGTDAQGIVLANPNAPTGRALPLADIERIIAAVPNRAVVIDEAYVDFGGETAAPLVKKYENLCVVRTFSKSYSLAGMRAGYALASPKLTGALKKIRDSFNSYPLDMLAQAAATAALCDSEYYAGTTARITETRESFIKALQKSGFSVIPSAANFVFARHKTAKAESLYQALREKGVLVRHFNKPRIQDFLRITIGTQEDMQACTEKLQEIIGSGI